MTKIQWTDESWNPLRARNKATGKTGHFCVKVSPGCAGCYAERMQPFLGNPVRYAAQDRDKVDLFLDEKELIKPLRWRKPRMVFPCSMTDLFGEFVPDEWIDRIFAVMALAPQHIFQVLTKRSERMREYLSHIDAEFHGSPDRLNERFGEHCAQLSGDPCAAGWFEDEVNWPLPNVWLGVSVEDRARLHRIGTLQNTPAALRFLSIEPLIEDLGEIDLTGIGWAIIGGESGNSARPFDIGWARNIIAQCRAAGVPVFMKQLGGRVYDDSRKADMPPLPEPEHAEPEDIAAYTRGFTRIYFDHAKGGNPDEWPADLRVREFPTIEGAYP